MRIKFSNGGVYLLNARFFDASSPPTNLGICDFSHQLFKWRRLKLRDITVGYKIAVIVAPQNFIRLIGQHRVMVDLQGDNILEEAIAGLFVNGAITRHLNSPL